MNELYTALAKAQGEMRAAAYDRINPHFKSRYATLASVIDAVREPLTKNGIAFVQKVSHTERGVGVETVFLGYGCEIATGMVVVPLDKATAQGMGSALTYARRYSLAMACCISADDDDDGNEAEKSAPKKRGGSVIDAVMVDVKADPVLAEQYAAGLKAAVFNEDEVYLGQLCDELKKDNELKLAVWKVLQPDSQTRAAINKFERERTAA